MKPHEKVYLALAGMFCLTLLAILPRDPEIDGSTWNGLDTIVYFSIMGLCVRTIWIAGRQSEREAQNQRRHKNTKHKL